jgi:hypothetical protein
MAAMIARRFPTSLLALAAGLTVGTLGAASSLMAQAAPQSVYAPPEPPDPKAGVNEGGVRFDIEVRYLTDYVFRGVEFLEVPGSEDSPNLQFQGKVSFDLGKLPHPFVDVFVNVADDDPISSFQEIRPTLGFDWTLKPFTLSAGHTSYIFPDRDGDNGSPDLDTNEIFARLELDDSYFFRSERPIFTPYVLAAYDYDNYEGLYLEAGLKHVLPVENTGLTLEFTGAVSYVSGHPFFSVDPIKDPDPSGFQHYQVGVTGRYSLNELFNVSRRYGEWSFVGYLFYTDGIDNDIAADTQLYGGAGISFRY